MEAWFLSSNILIILFNFNPDSNDEHDKVSTAPMNYIDKRRAKGKYKNYFMFSVIHQSQGFQSSPELPDLHLLSQLFLEKFASFK